MAAISKTNTELFYHRRLDKAREDEVAKHFIFKIASGTLSIANAIGTEIASQPTIQPKKRVVFQVNKELLKAIFTYIEKNIKTLNRFDIENIKNCLSTFNMPLVTYSDPFDHQNNFDTAQDLYNAILAHYRHINKFEKIPIEGRSTYSSYTYTIFRLHLVDELMTYITCIENQTAAQRVAFLIKWQKYRFATLPMCPNDVVVFYSESKEEKQMALVDKDPTKLIAKFGNKATFAYRYDFDRTPFEYGQYFRLLRRDPQE